MRNRKAILASSICVLLVAAALLVYYFKHKPSVDVTARPEKLAKITVNQAFEHLLYIGLYVAKDKAFFEHEGLDVNIETGGGDAQAFAALTSGQAQFAQGDPGFVAIAGEKGWSGRVVAMAVDRVAIWGVTFDKSIEPFTDPKRFAGRTVATYPEPNTSYVVQKQLALRAGLKLGEDTKIVQVPFGTELATLKNGQAAIAQTIEPNVSQVELQGGRVVFSYPDAWGPLAFTGVMTSTSYAEQDPKSVQAFINAYEAALQYIVTNPDGAAEVAIKRLPTLDPKVVRLALKRLTDSKCIPAHAAVDPESWKKLLQIRVDVGDLKALPGGELIDNHFAERARKK